MSEVRSTFNSIEEIQLGPKLESCTYLHACIEEGLRLLTGVAFWREAMEGGATVRGEYIPAGLIVGISPHVIHPREDIFPEPYRCLPERWIPGGKSSEDQIKAARAAPNTFSLGPRGCVARNLGMTALNIAVPTLLWSMDVRKAEGEEGKLSEGSPQLSYGRYRREQFQLWGSFTVNGKGPMLQVRQDRM